MATVSKEHEKIDLFKIIKDYEASECYNYYMLDLL